MNRSSGIWPDVSMADYRTINAIGSGRLADLAVSPLYYRWRLEHPPEETDAMDMGTALHMAVLEPALFARFYTPEPDWEDLGLSLNAKPRATKAYKEWVEGVELSGRAVMKPEDAQAIEAMATAVRSNVHARRILERAPEREVTLLWDRERPGLVDHWHCRGRADALGNGIMGDLKTTRSLADFNPWTISKRGYYRQAAHYIDGAEALGRPIQHFFFIAVENVPPYDVGVFTLDPDAIRVGQFEINSLLARLYACEDSGVWPGMFPEIQVGRITDSLASEAAIMEVTSNG